MRFSSLAVVKNPPPKRRVLWALTYLGIGISLREWD